MEKELWETILSQIQLMVSPANFATWFKGTKIAEMNEEKVVISVPNTFVKEWLEQKYHKTIFKILKSLRPQVKEIEYKVEKETKEIKPPSYQKEKEILSQLRILDFEINTKTGLNSKYTFRNFVVGSFNELAFAAAQAIVKSPGQVYNPLFVYGGVGLGKTHLLQAIGNEILNNFPALTVKYLQVNKLVSDIINAIQNKKIEKFKESFQNIDVLILDDVQFLAGKEKTQEEFFFIFNSLYEKNKQIVLSSDRPPKAIPSLTERLRSRFEGGMIVDISVPDFETRVAILKLKSEEKGVSFPDEVINYIAFNIKTNIRELEGALNILMAYNKLQKKEVDLKTAKMLLKNLIHPVPKVSNFKRVLKVISQFYEIDEKLLLSESRKKEIVKPRQIAMYILREDLKYSFPFIAQKFGGKDHTTVIHAWEKIGKEVEKDESLSEEIRQIRNKIFEEQF
ncbi:chromosomal replication initiator protein DnaA [Candidatus Parcubacteria bacterium]|nr:chromosomal replication initiator protein DnaA [Candidatus Parcubacteria bacterium]